MQNGVIEQLCFKKKQQKIEDITKTKSKLNPNIKIELLNSNLV